MSEKTRNYNIESTEWSGLTRFEKAIVVAGIFLILVGGVGAITFFLAALIYLVQLWLNVLGVLL